MAKIKVPFSVVIAKIKVPFSVVIVKLKVLFSYTGITANLKVVFCCY